MNKVDFQYNIKDKVKIKELDWKGIVTELCVLESGIKYGVRFFYNGDVKSSYFYENELEIIL